MLKTQSAAQGQQFLCFTESAVTSAACLFYSNALSVEKVMGFPKQMKLEANKVRGAN